jgi:hypothetical protein
MPKEYRVFQKAEIWYVTKVEANSPEEAQALVESNDFDGEWSLDLDTAIVNDEYDVHEVN